MVSCRRFFSLLGLILSTTGTTSAADLKGDGTTPDAPVVPGAYIVEFEGGQDTDSFYRDLEAADVSASRRVNLDSSLFKGCSFQLQGNPDGGNITEKIAEMPKVKNLWPVRLINFPKDEVIWAGNDSRALTAAQKRQESANDSYVPHAMTQVDKLRADGVTGKGIRIGIVDTGIDYRHPALGGCFGPGCLVSYGTDLVGDAYTGRNTPVPDPDPHDNCAGHGTHVAGIIAAQANPLGFTGAAPDVTLGAYRVFGCRGGTGNDVLIAAFLQAYEDGSDIITASVSGSSGWTEDPWAVTVQRIVEAGVPCTLSADNVGSNGLFFAASAANGKKVAAVGSVESTELPLLLLEASYSVGNSSPSQEFGWTAGNPSFPNITMPLWALAVNTNGSEHACEPLPVNTPDLSRYIVLVRQAPCSYSLQAENILAKGGSRMMVYGETHSTSLVYVADVKEMKSAGMVTARQGAEWIDLLRRGKEITLNIIDSALAGHIIESAPNVESGGYVSTFSSWGPTWEVDVKPQFTAPGGNILSTYPLALGGYAVLSGTSMSCPLAAAIYALVSQVRGTLDPETLERVLSSTSNPNVWFDGSIASNILAPVPQQGGGMLQAYDAAHTTTILSVSSISFNDTANFISSANFSIQNTGAQDVTYDLSHVEAVTMYTFEPGAVYPSYFPNPIANSSASLSFSSSKVTVPAGGSVEITVVPTPPAGLDASLLPVYSGYIALNGTNGESLSIPYLGVVGSMYEAAPIIDPNYAYLTHYNDPNLNPAPANETWTLPYPTPKTVANATIDYPTSLIQLNVGTPILRCDIVPVGDFAGNTTNVVGVDIVGSVQNFPHEYAPRVYFITAFTGMTAEGTVVPPGRYKFLVRALKIFGDRNKAEDYETISMVPFNLKYEGGT